MSSWQSAIRSNGLAEQSSAPVACKPFGDQIRGPPAVNSGVEIVVFVDEDSCTVIGYQ